MKKRALKFLCTAMMIAMTASVGWADKLDEIKARGTIKAGIHPGKAGFSTPDTKGQWEGFDIDFIKALAAAILKDSTKVEYVAMSSKNRLTALSSGEIDVLNRATTFSATRDNNNGVDTTAVWIYDGQGFLVRKSLGVTSAKELDGATLCVSPGTTSERNINDYFAENKMEYKAMVLSGSAEVVAAYENGRCDCITNDAFSLAAKRLAMKKPDEHMILPDIISKEPLGPYVRQGETRLREVVTWLVHALVAAEELGITQANVDGMAKNGSADVKRLLGSEGNIGAGFGLDNQWALRAIKAVGNYGEIFERNIGKGTPLGFERGLNAQWKDGGLMYAYPFR